MLSHALSLLEIAIVKDSYECESLKVRLGIGWVSVGYRLGIGWVSFKSRLRVFLTCEEWG